jgi:hypothetical protein
MAGEHSPNDASMVVIRNTASQPIRNRSCRGPSPYPMRGVRYALSTTP